MSNRSRRGITVGNVIVIMFCLVVLMAITLPFIALSFIWRNAAQSCDDDQLRGIHQSFLVFSRDFGGIYPTPGLVDRLPFEGTKIPGRGNEDISKNTTANLFSLCIMQNYFQPEQCYGPTEPSDLVRVFGGGDDYNYESYAPASGVYWDTNFKADLHKLSNVSYAHMPLWGETKLKQWRESMDPNWPVLGNRGPLGGVPNPNSITNRIHEPYDRWTGNVVFNDNHTEFLSLFPSHPRSPDGGYIISEDSLTPSLQPPDTDAIITFTKEMTDRGPVVQHD